MRKSLKQLLRTPVKTAIFFLLILAVSVLLTFSSVLYMESTQHITAMEGQFTTLGTIEQPLLSSVTTNVWASCYGRMGFTEDRYAEGISLDELDFPEAEYVTNPETRPYFLAEQPELVHSESFSGRYTVAEFTVLDAPAEYGAVRVRVEAVHCTPETADEKLRVGDEITVCLCTCPEEMRDVPQVGVKYIASLFRWVVRCAVHGTEAEYHVMEKPYTSQYNADGTRRETTALPTIQHTAEARGIDEVSADFWQTENGERWENWIAFQKSQRNLFYVTPTAGLQMLPVFQGRKASITEGREITRDEFQNGARICVVSEELLSKNRLTIGDTITLPLRYSMHKADTDYISQNQFDFSPLNAAGEAYDVFWEAEYTVVGAYRVVEKTAVYGTGELPRDLIVIPAASVEATDVENIVSFGPMHHTTTSFELPNGSIAKFDAALRTAVPSVEELDISYNDNGFENIMSSLRELRTISILLFVIGVAAAFLIVVLLLYFFIVKQKKRTAIERSLGMSKAQCRVSLMAGILVLALVASVIGVGVGSALLQADLLNDTAQLDAEEIDMTFSTWMQESTAVSISETNVPIGVYALSPTVLCAAIFGLSLMLVNQSLKIEPILLLSRKESNWQ